MTPRLLRLNRPKGRPDTITRYNISYVNEHGQRQLLGPNQGRFFKETREEAEQVLKQLEQRSMDTLVQVCGPASRGTFRVDPFTCWATGDAVGIYVEENT